MNDLILFIVCGNTKTVLWPVFHYLVQTSSGDSRTEKRHWDDYVAVNRQFADTIIDRYQENDISKYKSLVSIAILILYHSLYQRLPFVAGP